ncbi:hypothetical protein SBRCBS47491_007051 [Sporothrix bragantina]|uniref:HMG box domain-containing protein n=1 Tax=Sporothrix bragantina TaxID=671064 RepID=A0ABP0CBK3_9PEZI
MTQRLEDVLDELNLSQYYDSFVDQGFDTWDTILDITESDLDAMGVKLGHRRKLQRRIANFRGVAPDVALASPTRTTSEEASSSRQESVPKHEQPNYSLDSRGAVPGVLAKRKYRRHPKPDEAAPERPPSAYVLFSNKTREELKGRNLTFTEIAKHVGENWQGLTAAEREPFETQAQLAKEKYNSDLAEYKKTDDYKKYMVYLQEFKAKHSNQTQDKDAFKRIKLSDFNSSATSSHDTSSASPPSRAQHLTLHHLEHDQYDDHHHNKRPRDAMNDHGSRSGSEGPHDSDVHNSRKRRHGSAVSGSDYSASPSPTTMDHLHGTANSNPASSYRSPHSRPTSLSPRTQHESSAPPPNRNSTGKNGMQLSLPSLSHMFDANCQQRSPTAGGPPGSSADANGRASPGIPPHSMATSSSNTSNASATSYFAASNGSSVSSNGSSSHPRTPLEGSMPIHALLSGATAKPMSPTSPRSSASPHSASMPPHTQPYPHPQHTAQHPPQYQQQPYPAHPQHAHHGPPPPPQAYHHAVSPKHSPPPPSWSYGHGPSPMDRHPPMYKDHGAGGVARPAGPPPYQYRT